MDKMNLEDFLALTQEEQTAILVSAADMERKISELEAERNSLDSDYKKQVDLIKQLKTELQKTKEVNFTLARQVTKEEKEPEDLLHDLFSVK